MANWWDGMKCDEHGCDKDLGECMSSPCEGRAAWLEQEAAVSEYENSPQFSDPVAWAAENRHDPEAQADLALHDALHPYGYC